MPTFETDLAFVEESNMKIDVIDDLLHCCPPLRETKMVATSLRSGIIGRYTARGHL